MLTLVVVMVVMLEEEEVCHQRWWLCPMLVVGSLSLLHC